MKKALTELRRMSASFAGIGVYVHQPPAFREGQEDEYETMVNLETLKKLGYSSPEFAEIMPDVARCSRGLIAPPALPIKNYGNGIVCCDLDKFSEHLHKELGVFLVKGNREGIALAIRPGVSIPVHDRDGVDADSQKPFLLEDPTMTLRLLTAYHSHNSISLPLFVDYPLISADADPELVSLFECCVCLNIMKDPTSLGCGHSACLR
jgi:hypothetical protein